MTILLIVGLGNPGHEYERTRHNAGQWYVERLAQLHGANWKAEPRYFGRIARLSLHNHDIRLLIPTTYMNRSGQSTAALAGFFRITPGQMLVAHDELDLPAGAIRLKQGGGHGGHNGLRDIIGAHGNDVGFLRLRIGIGRPPPPQDVTPWVLGTPTPAEKERIDAAIDAAVAETAIIVSGDVSRAMNQINGFSI